MLVEERTSAEVEESLSNKTSSDAGQQQRITNLTFAAMPTSQVLQDGAIVSAFPTLGCLLLYAESQALLVSLKYTEIVLHAAISEPPSLYLQVESADLNLLFPNQASTPDLIEVFLKSSDGSSPQTLYTEMCKFAALCPSEDTDQAAHDSAASNMVGNLDHYWFSNDVDDDEDRFEDGNESNKQGTGQTDVGTEDPDDQPRKYHRTS